MPNPFEVAASISEATNQSDVENIQNIEPSALDAPQYLISNSEVPDRAKSIIDTISDHPKLIVPEPIQQLMDEQQIESAERTSKIKTIRESGRVATSEEEKEIQELTRNQQERIKKYVEFKVGTSDIDRETGATFMERLNLGWGAKGDEVRDKFMAQYPNGWLKPVKIPDVLGGGYQYVFKYDNDNENERYKLVNEEGFSLGDIAEHAKEGFILGGELLMLRGVLNPTVREFATRTGVGAALGGIVGEAAELTTPGGTLEEFMGSVFEWPGEVFPRASLDAALAGGTAFLSRAASGLMGPTGATTGAVLLRDDQIQMIKEIEEGSALGLHWKYRDKPKGWNFAEHLKYKFDPEFGLSPGQVAFNHPFLRSIEARALVRSGHQQVRQIAQQQRVVKEVDALPELSGAGRLQIDDNLNFQTKVYENQYMLMEDEIRRISQGTGYRQYGDKLNSFYKTWVDKQEALEGSAWSAVRNFANSEKPQFNLNTPRQWLDRRTGEQVQWTPQQIVEAERVGMLSPGKPKVVRTKDPATGKTVFKEIPTKVKIEYDPIGRLNSLMTSFGKLHPEKITHRDLDIMRRQVGKVIGDLNSDPRTTKSAGQAARAFYNVILDTMQNPVNSAPNYVTAFNKARGMTASKMSMYDLKEWRALHSETNPIKQARYFSEPENFTPEIMRDIQRFATQEEKEGIKNGVMNSIIRSNDPLKTYESWRKTNPEFLDYFVFGANPQERAEFGKALINLAQLRNSGTAHIAKDVSRGLSAAREFLYKKDLTPGEVSDLINNFGGIGSKDHNVVRQAIFKEIMDNVITTAPSKTLMQGQRVVNPVKLNRAITTLKGNGVWESGILTHTDQRLLSALTHKVNAINSIDQPTLIGALTMSGSDASKSTLPTASIMERLLTNDIMARLITHPVIGKMLVNTKGNTIWTGKDLIKLNLMLNSLLETQDPGSTPKQKIEGMQNLYKESQVNPNLSSKQSDYDDAFSNVEQKYKLEPGLLKAMAWKESRFNPMALNKDSGASGIMQIVPKWHPNVDVFDPYESIDYAGRYMRELIDRYDGNVRMALAAYNHGLGNIDKKGLRNLPKETKDYIGTIYPDNEKIARAESVIRGML